jgi:DNA-binding MurR/RpiR family transcriptional regulator
LASGGSLPIYDEVRNSDSVGQIIGKVIASTARSVEDSREIIDSAAVESIRDAILKAERIVVTGIGASSAIAFDLSHKLLKLGLNATFSHDPHMINIMCGNLTRKDLLITFSHSGESREMLDAVKLASKSSCPIAAVTSYPRSSLALFATWVVLSSSKETQYRSDTLTSRIIQICVIDMLYISLAVKMGKPALDSINRSRVAVAKNKT